MSHFVQESLFLCCHVQRRITLEDHAGCEAIRIVDTCPLWTNFRQVIHLVATLLVNIFEHLDGLIKECLAACVLGHHCKRRPEYHATGGVLNVYGGPRNWIGVLLTCDVFEASGLQSIRKRTIWRTVSKLARVGRWWS